MVANISLAQVAGLQPLASVFSSSSPPLHSSPHDKVVPIDVLAVAGAAQVPGVAHNSTAPAGRGLPGPVWILSGNNLEELAQHFVKVVGLELGLQHL